jgi:hypothetical protein
MVLILGRFTFVVVFSRLQSFPNFSSPPPVINTSLFIYICTCWYILRGRGREEGTCGLVLVYLDEGGDKRRGRACWYWYILTGGGGDEGGDERRGRAGWYWYILTRVGTREGTRGKDERDGTGIS